MHQLIDRGGVDACTLEQLFRPGHDRATVVVRTGKQLQRVQGTIGGGQHDIRECAADVDADPESGLRLLHFFIMCHVFLRTTHDCGSRT